MDAASVIYGGYYAGWHSKSESYRRVKVTGKTGGSVGVHYIDYGEIDVIPINCIRPLPAEFADFPAQAMRAQLFGKLSFPYYNSTNYNFSIFQELNQQMGTGLPRMHCFLRSSLTGKFSHRTSWEFCPIRYFACSSSIFQAKKILW